MLSRAKNRMESETFVNGSTGNANVSDVTCTQTMNSSNENTTDDDVEYLDSTDNEIMSDEVLSADDECTADVTTATCAGLVNDLKNDPYI